MSEEDMLYEIIYSRRTKASNKEQTHLRFCFSGVIGRRAFGIDMKAPGVYNVNAYVTLFDIPKTAKHFLIAKNIFRCKMNEED